MHRALVLLPAVAAAVAFAVPSERARPLVLPVTGTGHLGLTLFVLRERAPVGPDDWLGADALGGLMLAVVSVLFLICALYAPPYLRARADQPNRVFCFCLLAFLSMASLLILSQDMGLLWVALEGTTLACAPLVYWNRNARSIEATWKYLMVGSVGIALALLGSLFLSYSAHVGGGAASLHFSSLIANAGRFSTPWLRAAFVFLLVGYGTKMGLAPLHTWKPDVYGEAPGLVGALFAGGMTTCAFLALLRAYRIVSSAGEGPFARSLFVLMGLTSIVWAAVFMVRQQDFKRMLAYSSVEHMGILVLGVGIGGAGLWAAILHTVNNALTKGVLFLAAGNIHSAYGSKSIHEVSGAMRRLPVSASLFLAGLFAVTGSPPFGPFVSEFTILDTALGQGRYFVGAAFLVLLAVIFVGMGATVLAVVQGAPPEGPLSVRYRDTWARTAPIALSMALVLLLGVWIPAPLARSLDLAAQSFEATP